MNIVLTGPMGSGKTTVGKAVANTLGMKFIDTDDIIVEKAQMSINDIFSKHGEEHFRELERPVIVEVSELDNHVIATGGGVVLSSINMRRLRLNGNVINLRASPDTLYGRLKGAEDRPLLDQADSKEELRKHSEGRIRFYNNADFIIETDDLEPKKVEDKIINITKSPYVRICGCVAGDEPEKQIESAVENGASMIELRLDLIPDPDIQSLIDLSGVPVIATDRKDKKNLIKAIEAGCDFIDVEIESPEREMITEKARAHGCRVIASLHDFEKTPADIPTDKGTADILKIATTVNCGEDGKRLLDLLRGRDDLIVLGMGGLGGYTRIVAPLLGSYLTYASLVQSTAPGQLSLEIMYNFFKRMGLR